MKLVVAQEHRFVRVGDHTYSTVFTYERTWKRYLQVFDEVYVFARVEHHDTVPDGRQRADAPNVHFLDVPCFIGPWQFLKMRKQVEAKARQAADIGDAFVLRVPGTVGSALYKQLKRLGLPHGVEVVGDPWDSFAPGASRSIVRPYVRHQYTKALKEQCASAVAASYVTKSGLQKRYPPGGWSTNYSSVMLTDDAYVSADQLAAKQQALLRPRTQEDPWTCINVGTMSQMYKRQDLAIEMIARLRNEGIPIELTLVGDGQYQPQLEQQAKELGVENAIHFAGRVDPGGPVRDLYDRSDFFILTSRQEGLPRVNMESMARGLPVISTDVGGIAELVDASELIAPDDLDAAVSAVRDLVTDPPRMAQLAEVNLSKAKDYHHDILNQRAKDFCEQLLAHSRTTADPTAS